MGHRTKHTLVSLELIQCRACPTYLGYRRRKDNNLIKLAHPLHKLVNTRTFYNVYIVVIALDLDGYREVGLVENLKNRENAILIT